MVGAVDLEVAGEGAKATLASATTGGAGLMFRASWRSTDFSFSYREVLSLTKRSYSWLVTAPFKQIHLDKVIENGSSICIYLAARASSID